MINVTKPFLPPIEEYNKKISTIWENYWLTNRGPLVNELEQKLLQRSKLKNILYTSNGTIALQIALKALNITQEVITTPFSYIATTSSILWENCSVKFCDIDINTFNIDVDKLENHISENTEAILVTHVFGNPCDIEKLNLVCKKNKLKLIFDSAHCFDTKYKNQSVLNYGDISTISFHATKLFHTIEGGAIICNDSKLHEIVKLNHNFGHASPTTFERCGINGKNSEFHAAMGLCNLKYIDEICDRRKHQWSYYINNLGDLNLRFQKLEENSEYNYSYFPIVFETETELENIILQLNNHYINPRRYFYPSLNIIPYINSVDSCPNSEFIASRILCLPLYHELKSSEQDLIISILRQNLLC